jgi:hypothetical protein
LAAYEGLAAVQGEKRYNLAMARQIIWVEHIQSWGCSDCTWVFIPSGPPIGNTIDDMKGNFTAKRAKQFKSHVCAKQSRIQAKERRFPKKIE